MNAKAYADLKRPSTWAARKKVASSASDKLARMRNGVDGVLWSISDFVCDIMDTFLRDVHDSESI